MGKNEPEEKVIICIKTKTPCPFGHLDTSGCFGCIAVEAERKRQW